MTRAPITDRGKSWELLNSLWIITAFVPLLNWTPFLYIGIRANQSKWIYIGLIYSIPFILSMLAGTFKQLANLGSLTALIALIFSIPHAFMLRKEYLIRQDILDRNSAKTIQLMRQKISAEYGTPFSNTSEVSIPPRKNVDLSPGELIDINNVEEQVIASFPGVGPILAKKAVQFRHVERSFTSVDDFAEVLGLKPHIVEQIRSRIVINPIQANKVRKQSEGRIVDF
jgi:Helix-hairpin-helix motif